MRVAVLYFERGEGRLRGDGMGASVAPARKRQMRTLSATGLASARRLHLTSNHHYALHSARNTTESRCEPLCESDSSGKGCMTCSRSGSAGRAGRSSYQKLEYHFSVP